MKLGTFFKLVFLCLSLASPSFSLGTSSFDSCDCPPVSCNADCEYEQSVSFYTEKCEGGAKLRSCAKPKCIPLDPIPAQCTQATHTEKQNETEPASTQREPASNKLTPISRSEVGQVSNLFGEASVISEGEASPRQLQASSKVREMDTIITGRSGRVEITFFDDNQIYISPNSQIQLTQVLITNDDSQRRVLTKAIKGQTRHKVKQSYKGANSFYRVNTGTAVAGVRGTDFIVSVEAVDGNMVSSVQNLSGSVVFNSGLGDPRVVLTQGQSVSFLAAGITEYGDQSEKKLREIMPKSKMSPVEGLSVEEIYRMNREYSFEQDQASAQEAEQASARRPSSTTCLKPAADFGQCSWTCENNPKGERSCRTDLPGVNCVRRACNANGQWTSHTRLPSAFSIWCDPEKVIVKDCDY